MNSGIHKSSQTGNESGKQPDEAERTLRLLAGLEPPEGLKDRVHNRLRMAQAAPRRPWLFALPSPRLQLAAASLVVVALAGGGWNLYRIHNAAVLATPPHQVAPGGFDSSHTMHVPPTLAPIHVPPAPKKKPGAGRSAVHPAPKTAVKAPASEPSAAEPPSQP